MPIKSNAAQFAAKAEAAVIAWRQGLKDAVVTAAQQVARDAKQAAPVDTGNLRKLIYAGEVQEAGDRISCTVGTQATYAAPVEYGSRPHCPPFNAILDWVIRKGIAARMTAKGYRSKARSAFLAQASAAYLIMRKIQQKGTKPHPYLMPPVPAALAGMKQAIRDLAARLLK